MLTEAFCCLLRPNGVQPAGHLNQKALLHRVELCQQMGLAKLKNRGGLVEQVEVYNVFLQLARQERPHNLRKKLGVLLFEEEIELMAHERRVKSLALVRAQQVPLEAESELGVGLARGEHVADLVQNETHLLKVVYQLHLRIHDVLDEG